jgi:hypothetical protein
MMTKHVAFARGYAVLILVAVLGTAAPGQAQSQVRSEPDPSR